ALPDDEDDDDEEEGDDEEQPQGQHVNEGVAEDRGNEVPDGVEGDADEVAADRREVANPSLVGLARQAEADAGHRGVERMTPRREHAADDEGPGELVMDL